MDRTIQPEIQALKNFHILSPVRTTLPNGVPLTVVNAGEQELVRMDILFAGGRWQQSQKLQALFTNRMLREVYGGNHCREAGLLWFMARTVQFVGVCLYHCLLVEQVSGKNAGSRGIHD